MAFPLQERPWTTSLLYGAAVTYFWMAVTIILILLTWRIWWAPNNASKWQMGFNWAFKGLKCSFKIMIWRQTRTLDPPRHEGTNGRDCSIYRGLWSTISFASSLVVGAASGSALRSETTRHGDASSHPRFCFITQSSSDQPRGTSPAQQMDELTVRTRYRLTDLGSNLIPHQNSHKAFSQEDPEMWSIEQHLHMNTTPFSEEFPTWYIPLKNYIYYCYYYYYYYYPCYHVNRRWKVYLWN